MWPKVLGITRQKAKTSAKGSSKVPGAGGADLGPCARKPWLCRTVYRQKIIYIDRYLYTQVYVYIYIYVCIYVYILGKSTDGWTDGRINGRVSR